MSEKRFEYGETDLFEWVEDNGKMISTKECVNLLNEMVTKCNQLEEENEKLKEENEKLKKQLEIRTESDKYHQRMLLKWLCKDEDEDEEVEEDGV